MGHNFGFWKRKSVVYRLYTKPKQRTSNMTAEAHFLVYTQHFVHPSETQFADFMAATRLERYQKNDLLVKAGTVCDRVWFVHRGILRHYLVHQEQEGTVWFSFGGDLLTEVYSLIHRVPAVHNIIAVTDCELLSISQADLQRFYDTDHLWERFGRLTTVQYLFLQMQRTNDLLFKTGKEKYEAFVEAHPEALLHIPLRQIADFIGVKMETLSRLRSKRQK
jgi:CRP/FNR family transcriptional regulator, anaerobic regulatory protein